MNDKQDRIRLDKWLWQARFFRTRRHAADIAGKGRIRVNGTRVSKPGYGVKQGDVLSFAQGTQVRVIRVLAFGLRRGPASEAQQLYEDLEGGRDRV